MGSIGNDSLRLFASREQVALSAGDHWFGVRTAEMRELWSERNRLGWRVRYLPFGLRLFYRYDPKPHA